MKGNVLLIEKLCFISGLIYRKLMPETGRIDSRNFEALKRASCASYNQFYCKKCVDRNVRAFPTHTAYVNRGTKF